MKRLIGVDVGSYTFNAATKTITISGTELKSESVLLVVHVPSNTILYNFSSTAKGGTFTLPGTLVLDVDTSSYLNADPLQIYVDVNLPEQVELVKDSSPDSLVIDIDDIYLKALLRKLMQLKFTSSSNLSVDAAGSNIGTVTTVTTVSQGNMAFGDAGKPASYLQISALSGNAIAACYVWE